VLEAAEFMKANMSIFNHCKRYNLKVGIVGLQIVNCEALSRELTAAACSHFNRQLRFLLSENARSYEPWCVLDGGHVFFSIIQVSEEDEFEYYVRRFAEIISGTEFMLGSRRIEPVFRICALMPEPAEYDVDLYDNYENDIINGLWPGLCRNLLIRPRPCVMYGAAADDSCDCHCHCGFSADFRRVSALSDADLAHSAPAGARPVLYGEKRRRGGADFAVDSVAAEA
jgi:hypothetical protein